MLNKKAQIISSEYLYKGTWLNLRKDHVVKPDGSNRNS